MLAIVRPEVFENSIQIQDLLRNWTGYRSNSTGVPARLFSWTSSKAQQIEFLKKISVQFEEKKNYTIFVMLVFPFLVVPFFFKVLKTVLKQTFKLYLN